MKKNAFIAVGFSSALLYTVGTTLPAMAKTVVLKDGTTTVAIATFYPNGNYFKVWDEDKDGRRAIVKYKLPGDDVKKCRNKRGEGSDPKVCPLKGVKENLTFQWKLCVKDGDGDSGEPKLCKPKSGWIKDKTGR